MTATVDLDDFNRYAELRQEWYCFYAKNTKSYYAVRTTTVNGKKGKQLMHRLIAGVIKGEVVDHENHDTLDNRRQNLRICTHQKNLQNKKTHIRPHKGVSWRSREGKYQARIKTNGKETSLGYYSTIQDAIEAYNAGAKKLFGEFANLNP